MRRNAYKISALFAALLVGSPALSVARADLRTPIEGAAAVLPSRFISTTPSPNDALKPAALLVQPESAPTANASDNDSVEPAGWMPPLFERTLTQAERARDLAPSLKEAILRMAGLYDVIVGVDPSENRIGWVPPAFVPSFARQRTTASYMAGLGPCEVYARQRSHKGHSLSLASPRDCFAMMRLEPWHLRGVERSAFASASDTAPVFAAPLPGARMSSKDFWAAQKQRVHDMEAKLNHGWHERDGALKAIDLDP